MGDDNSSSAFPSVLLLSFDDDADVDAIVAAAALSARPRRSVAEAPCIAESGGGAIRGTEATLHAFACLSSSPSFCTPFLSNFLFTREKKQRKMWSK